jgi:hypothetical protein
MKVRVLTMVVAGLALTAGFASAAVNPPEVPEPSSLVLLASAFGAGAFALRRRRK